MLSDTNKMKTMPIVITIGEYMRTCCKARPEGGITGISGLLHQAVGIVIVQSLLTLAFVVYRTPSNQI